MSSRNGRVYMHAFFNLGRILALSTFIWLLISTGALAAEVLKTDRMEGFVLLMLVLVSISKNMLDYLVYKWYLWFVLWVGMSLNRYRILAPEDGADMHIMRQRNLAIFRFPTWRHQ